MPNKIITASFLRMMRGTGHVACVSKKRTCIEGFGGETCKKETTWKTLA